MITDFFFVFAILSCMPQPITVNFKLNFIPAAAIRNNDKK